MPRLLRPRLVCLVCGHFGCWLGGLGVCGALTEGRVTRQVRLEDTENGEDADNKQSEEDEPVVSQNSAAWQGRETNHCKTAKAIIALVESVLRIEMSNK